MTLDKSMEIAARDLPEGWTVEVCVENGAAWCRLDHDGEGVEVDCSDMTLAEQVEACVMQACCRNIDAVYGKPVGPSGVEVRQ